MKKTYKRQILQERFLQNSWLIIPMAVIGVVILLALTHQRQGLIETFQVTTTGNVLPPVPANTVLPGTQIPQLKREHIPDKQKVKYNSNPPTSGPHYAIPAQWGIYNQAPEDERLVHNLEHGGIIISYNPKYIEGDKLDQIQAQVEKLSQINPRIILTPRSNLNTAIALTAWGYLENLNNYEPAAVKTFYNAHIARAPECDNGQCPG